MYLRCNRWGLLLYYNILWTKVPVLRHWSVFKKPYITHSMFLTLLSFCVPVRPGLDQYQPRGPDLWWMLLSPPQLGPPHLHSQAPEAQRMAPSTTAGKAGKWRVKEKEINKAKANAAAEAQNTTTEREDWYRSLTQHAGRRYIPSLSHCCVCFRWFRPWPVTGPTPYGNTVSWTPLRYRAVVGNPTPRTKSSEYTPYRLRIHNKYHTPPNNHLYWVFFTVPAAQQCYITWT